MIVFFITFTVLALVIGGMAIGVIMGRKPISGSCGGMAAVGIDSKCEICGGNPKKCDEVKTASSEPQDLGYDVGAKK